ncbi:hypothetical protein GDO78_013710 [Eleutherodactylus coqui]|uniref:Uncharacterized protein n=1 Tax=Eleutherodactylus coqui TaxID=57060 RepID=A0A8J6EFN3_ELECQ|nr:hypothetical protein GDO78_013710 [Eleutherodactylus coqui]
MLLLVEGGTDVNAQPNGCCFSVARKSPRRLSDKQHDGGRMGEVMACILTSRGCCGFLCITRRYLSMGVSIDVIYDGFRIV